MESIKEVTIVDKINAENLIKYGPIQPCCELYLAFCGCKKNK